MESLEKADEDSALIVEMANLLALADTLLRCGDYPGSTEVADKIRALLKRIGHEPT